MSLLIRLCVSSTIIRIRRRRRRSTKAERTSVVISVSNFGMSGHAGKREAWRSHSAFRKNRKGIAKSSVFAVTLGPDLIRHFLVDQRFVIADCGPAHRANRHVIQHPAGERPHERDDLRQALAHETRADLFRYHSPFDSRRFQNRGDALLADAYA